MRSDRKNVPESLPAEEIVTVLLISPFKEDCSFLRKTFHHPQWRILYGEDCRAASEILEKESPPHVILCESTLTDGTWKDILYVTQSIRLQPNLVVASRHADEYLWAEVLNLGGYDVLVKPFEPAEVLRVIGMATTQFTNRRKQRKSARSLTSGASYQYGS
jgi:DNA-binding NtrC family response regulator